MTAFAPHPLFLPGGTKASKVQLLRKPMYCPSGEGYACRIDKTAQDWTTLLFPRPSFPYLLRIHCLYATFRKLSKEKLKSSALMSPRAFIHTSKISLSLSLYIYIYIYHKKLRCFEPTGMPRARRIQKDS